MRCIFNSRNRIANANTKGMGDKSHIQDSDMGVGYFTGSGTGQQFQGRWQISHAARHRSRFPSISELLGDSPYRLIDRHRIDIGDPEAGDRFDSESDK